MVQLHYEAGASAPVPKCSAQDGKRRVGAGRLLIIIFL